MKRLAQTVSILAVLLCNAFTSWINAADTQQRSKQPNVLFIAIDDLNNYALGLNSEATAKTPHLQRLAERGTLFSNAHCAAPACNPSRAAVMTGVAPFNSGVYMNSQDWRDCER